MWEFPLCNPIDQPLVLYMKTKAVLSQARTLFYIFILISIIVYLFSGEYSTW
jgi:hypothetical protein